MNLNFKIIAPAELPHNQVSSYSFDELGGTIGRKPGNDLVLEDPERYISSKHAVIEFRNKHFYITDTSTNGVFLNNATQPVGAGNTAEIMNGDKITIGAYQLLAHITETKDVKADNDLWQMQNIPQQKITPQQYPAYKDPLDGLIENAVDIHDSNKFAGDSVDPLELLGDNNLPSANPPSEKKAPYINLGHPDLDELFGETEHYVNDSSSDILTSDILRDLDSSSSAKPAVSVSNKPQPVTIDEQFTPPSNFIPEDWDIFDSGKGSANTASNKKPGPSVEKEEDIFAALARPASPTVSKTVSPPDQQAPQKNSMGSDDLLQAFLQGCGVDLSQIRFKDQLSLMLRLGEITRINTEGVMQVLRARATIKSSFRVSKTSISPIENNPLKFSVTADDALAIILSDDRKGYMSGTDAFRESFNDLQSHQLALMAGMQATVSTIIDQLDPVQLEKSFEMQSGASFIPGQKKSRNWDAYINYYNRLKDRLQDDFQNVYGEEFAKAYEEQILKLTR